VEKDKLRSLILERSLKVADEPVFKLSSGKLSRYYVDLKQITFDPEGSYLVGKLMYEVVKKFDPDGVGGLTLGADPIAYSIFAQGCQGVQGGRSGGDRGIYDSGQGGRW